MKTAILLIIITLGLTLMIVYACGKVEDSVAARTYAEAAKMDAYGRAQAQIIQAQAESRLHAAEAGAITSAAVSNVMLSALPWGILGILGLLGLGVVALAFVVVTRPPRQPMLIERQVFYLPAPGQSRREVWQALSDTARPDTLLLPGERTR